METSFDEKVNGIVNQYINSVLFIDEEAFSQRVTPLTKEKPTNLNNEAVSRAFSEAGKMCSFFAPVNLKDIDLCKQLALKPDIVVLDWNIRLEQDITDEAEDQDDETDDRGHYTIEIIKTIVDDASDEKLKVVFIYTGEPGLNSIISDIYESLGNKFIKDDENYEVYSENIHILVRLKPDSKVSHIGLDNYKVSYESLPDVVIGTFAKYVNGLLPCFAMTSLSGIRESSAKILKVYNNTLDSEFLGHQLALSNPDDAKSYLANSFGSAITELILEDSQISVDNWVGDWIDSRFSNINVKKNFVDGTINVSSSAIKAFYDSRLSGKNIKDRLNDAFSSKCNSGGDAIKKSLSLIFHKDDDDIPLAKYNFAALAYNKNLFSTRSHTPILTLGTIVKELGQENNYYLCIQQRCDTARVKLSGMDYVFIPLHKQKTQQLIGAIALGPGDNRYVIQSSSNARLFHFSPDIDKSPVTAIRIGEKYVFKSSTVDFEWINELKDIIAQRIVVEITSHFARVGIDEAEWLRLERTITK